jgi:hypothetical protein
MLRIAERPEHTGRPAEAPSLFNMAGFPPCLPAIPERCATTGKWLWLGRSRRRFRIES